MKIAFYIEDGLEQIVLTPDGATEKALLGRLHDGSRDFSLFRGTFYECRGGWTRHGSSDDSTIIVMRPKPNPSMDEEFPDPDEGFQS